MGLLKIFIVILHIFILTISYELICKVTKKDWAKPEWYKKFMRISGKMYNDQKSVAICQSCGYRKNVR